MARERRSFGNFFKQAEPIVIRLNTYSLFDVYTGTYHEGMRGERILNGGIAPFMGFVAAGNMFKSTIMNDLNLKAFKDHYKNTEFFVYDTENLASYERYKHLAEKIDFPAEVDFYDESWFSMTKSEDMIGNKWFEAFKDYMSVKEKDKKALLKTPFKNPKTGTNVEWYFPSITMMDSISAFTTDSIESIFDKAETGESERNTLFMKDGIAKTQLMMELKDTLTKSGQYFSTVAHVGSTVNMDGKPERKHLIHMRQGEKMKGVPNKFDFYTSVCYEIFAASPIVAADKKGPLYPEDAEDDLRGDVDLMELSIRALRNKYGVSGIPFKIVVSQKHGYQPSLTDFHYCREYDYYGIIGGGTPNNKLELMPDVNFTRKSLRTKIKEDPKFVRALGITAELCMMENLWGSTEWKELKCTPKELYEDIKALGYNWDELLDTRRHWIYEDESHPQHYLSVMDLLRMRKGLYKPYWMK